MPTGSVPRGQLLRYALAAALLLSSLAALLAQVTFTSFPADFQLLPHDRATRLGSVPVAGTVAAGTGVQRVRAVLTTAGATVAEATADLDYGSGAAAFSLSLPIPSTRANHVLRVYLDEAVEPVAVARDLVAGEVYVVNGQSNAVANFTMAAVDRDSFLRGLRINDVTWDLMQFSDPGQWAGRAARVVSERHDVPVAVFNYAVGAQPISFFAPASGSGNFEELVGDLATAGVGGRVHNLFWFQGEANGWTSTVDEYAAEFRALYDDYRAALGAGNGYLLQTRTYSCSHPQPFVMEAQRRLGLLHADLTTIATTAAVHDSCHFPYEGGYRVLGNRLADLLSAREFGADLGPVYSPRPVSAQVTGSYEVTVEIDADGAGLTHTGAPWSEFRAEGVGSRPTGGRVEGNRVVLAFDADVVEATGVSYLSHAGPADDFVVSDRGHGLLTFYDFPVSGGERFAPGPRPDAELSFASEAGAVGEAEAFTAVLTLANRGARALRDVAVRVPLPRPWLVYQGGAEGVPTAGTFDYAIDTWTVPELEPGAAATLTLGYFVVEPAPTFTLWAEVASATETDVDSRPANGTVYEVAEDDEARLIINDRERDCSLSVGVDASACVGGDYWDLRLQTTHDEPSGRTLSLALGDGPARSWTTGAARTVRLRADSLAALDLRRVRLAVARAADPTCANAFDVFVPEACLASAASPPPARAAVLRLFPNPVAAGSTLALSVHDAAYAVDAPTHADVHDLTGRAVARLPLDGGAVRLPADLPAGVYVLSLGQRRGRFVVQ